MQRICRNLRVVVGVCVVLSVAGCAEFNKTLDGINQSLTAFNKGLKAANRDRAHTVNRVDDGEVCPDCGERIESAGSHQFCPASWKKPINTARTRTANSPSLRPDGSGGSLGPTRRSRTRKVAIVLVHGTTRDRRFGVLLGSESWTDPRIPGSFAAHLQSAFVEADPRARIKVVAFHWEGDNSNADRHNGGIDLAQYLDRLPDSVECHVVAHSHGGNVVLRALTFSQKDASSVILLGTPHLGVNVRIAETGKTYSLPLYFPLPRQAANTSIVNIYSRKDSVATMWADLLPGTTFSDLRYTNAEDWRSYWRLDRVLVRSSSRSGRAGQVSVQPTHAIYDFTTGDGVISQTIPAGLGRQVVNIELGARTGLDLPRRWVHKALLSPRVARAIGRAIATMDLSGFSQQVGVLTK